MSKCKKSDDKNLPKRSRYYQGMIDLDLIQKGKNYNELKKSFVIFICTFDPFKKGRHLYTFENRCLEDLTLHLNDATTKIFLNTKGSLNDVNQEMIEFLTYIENSTDDYANEIQNELVKTIHNKVKYIKTDKSMEVGTHQEKFQEGVEQTKLDNAKAFLDLADDKTIAERIGLPLETVQQLRLESMNHN